MILRVWLGGRCSSGLRLVWWLDCICAGLDDCWRLLVCLVRIFGMVVIGLCVVWVGRMLRGFLFGFIIVDSCLVVGWVAC